MNQELIHSIWDHFITHYKFKPLLVFSPGRINLIGEHTDYNEGFVFPAAIDKGIFAALNKSASNFSFVEALDVNEQLQFSLNNIQPIKNGGWKNYILGVVAEIQKAGKKIQNFNLVFSGDIPVGSGLSSSAALENSLVFGLNELFKLGLSKIEMVIISQQAEHNFVDVKCGIMDQYASMFGEENCAILLDCRSLEATTVNIHFNDYEILLINTNVKHSLGDSEYNNRRSVCEKIAALLNVNALRDASESDLNSIKNQISEGDYQKALFVVQEIQRVHQASIAITNNEIETLGKLLFESHDGLQNQYRVSCIELDFLVEAAKENPYILGARMMGGGFGGCTLNLIAKEAVELFKENILEDYKERFNIDCTFYNLKLSNGTQIINGQQYGL